MALTIPLPVDVNGRRFVGWGASGAAWLPSGTRIGSTDFAVPHALLVDASGNALVVGVDLDSGGGTANRVGIALLVPASGGPAVVPGDATLGLKVQSPAGAATIAKAEDAASANADVGVGLLAVRKATPANTSDADGDYEFVQMSAGRVWVSGITTDLVPGTAATNLGKAEDAAHTSGDTGVMALAVRKDVPTALATTDGDYAPPEVDSLGSTWVRQQTVAASTDVLLNSSASSAQLLASNTARRGLLLTNTDANDVYVYYGTTAVATKFTVKIPSGAYWEMPQPIYSGRIDAIWSADGSGALIGSEL